MLKATIVVWSTHLALDALRTRLATTEVIAATTLPPPPVGAYEAGALVPSTAWRRLSGGEFAQLAGGSFRDAPGSASVVLLAPNPSFTAELAAIAADQAIVAGKDSLHPAPADLQARMDRLIASDGTFTRLGPPLSTCVSKSPGGLNTLTPNPDRSLAGLHVDSWDGLVLGQRRHGSNRLVINIGAHPRYLIFAPYEVAAIAEMMHLPSETGLDVARAFLLQGDRRVYRLEVRPGEAYLAPTENLIHDASSLGAVGPDRALMLRGFLRLAAERRAPRRVIDRSPADLYVPEAARHAAFEDALSTLGRRGEARVLERRRGAVNDIYRLQTTDGRYLALRIRGRVLVQEVDGWLAKSALCAELMERGCSPPRSINGRDTKSVAVRGPIPFGGAATIHAYRHGCASADRPPWELCEWIAGPLAGEAAEPCRFAELGRRLAALHDVRFATFRTGLGPQSRETDGAAWLRACMRGFLTPALEQRIGLRHATSLRHGQFDLKALRWSLVHGDLHAGNVIVGADGVRIIDWDEAGVGPPEFEFAPLKYGTRLESGRVWVPDSALYDAALNGYRGAGGVADGKLLALGELLFLLKRFHASHIEGRPCAAEDAVDGIVNLTVEVFA